MTLGQRLLRLLGPQHERDRMEVREAVTLAAAHAQNLTHTTEKLLNGGLRMSCGTLRSIKRQPE